MGFQLSPGVVTSEIDLTTIVPAVSSSTGAFAGTFNWGPVNYPVQITNETKLVEFFGKPDSNTAVSFFTCANFLSYAGDMRVVRCQGTGTYSAVSNTSSTGIIKNDDDYVNNFYLNTNDNIGPFASRYPGAKGNSLKVSICADSSSFANWQYKSYFTAAPGTSTYAENISSGCQDEMHIVVVDEDGLFTGTKDTVLESYAFVSKASDAKDAQGSTNYFRTVIYNKSRYVYPVGRMILNDDIASTVGQVIHNVSLFDSGTYTASLVNGADGTVTAAAKQVGFGLFANPEKIDISLIMTGDADNATILSAIDIAETRKDCVVFVSPTLANCQAASPADAIVSFRSTSLSNISTSYAVMDGNWKYQYDKYNDLYRWLPMNGDIAGLCARTDQVRDAWWSPAGLTRGNIKNVVKLAWYPERGERDTLYKNGVNPVISQPGTGTILFGDKTLLAKPSAFDRINVRRLFIVLEKAIAIAAKSSLFEFNDDFTRASFKGMVEPFLRTVKGRRGIYDFRVVCDTTNNTPDIVDRNEFIGDIYIKPARSINFIQLNFVAVRSGVSFDEVVGKF